jgi:hypothetical protein
VTSPGVPADRVAVLRKAFDSMMKDPAYLSEMQKAGLGVQPVAGARLQTIVRDFMNTPPEVVARARDAMEPRDVRQK